jgi:hypothetical protein
LRFPIGVRTASTITGVAISPSRARGANYNAF